MKTWNKRIHSAGIGIGLLLLLFSFTPAQAQQARCMDIVNRPLHQLNILTLNLLFSEVNMLYSRLSTLADFISNNKVDVVLLQEVLAGPVPAELLLQGEPSTAAVLQKLLTGYGVATNLKYRMADGVPGVFTIGNAILTRCQIDGTLASPLPLEPSAVPNQIPLLERRNVVMTRLRIPNVGKINVYTTHLCADCTAAGRLDQIRALSRFVQIVEWAFPGNKPLILGGDFNLNLAFPDNTGAIRQAYDEITSGKLRLTDTYAAFTGHETSCVVGNGGVVTLAEGCTDGVSDIADRFTPGEPTPQRIDYIFARGFNSITQSRVVFNPRVDSSQPSVSDHSAVFSTVALSR